MKPPRTAVWPRPFAQRLRGALAFAIIGLGWGLTGPAIGSTAAVTSTLSILTEDDLPGPSRTRVEELLRRSGIKHTTTVLPWARAYDQALKQPNVCVYSTTRTPEREALFEWVAPLRATQWVLLARSDDKRMASVKTLEDARRFVIGAYRQDAVAQFLAQQGFRLELVDTNIQNIKKLSLGRIDLWATASAVLPELLSEAEFKDRIRVQVTLRETTVYLACHPKSDRTLMKRLRDAWGTMVADGTIKRMDAQGR